MDQYDVPLTLLKQQEALSKYINSATLKLKKYMRGLLFTQSQYTTNNVTFQLIKTFFLIFENYANR